MAYDLTGKIKLVQDLKTFDSGFTKREMVVIVEDGKYPQEINLEFVQDKVSLLNDLQVDWVSSSRRSNIRQQIINCLVINRRLKAQFLAHMFQRLMESVFPAYARHP